MCYVIPIVHAMLLRQDMKKARLPTQAPLWVNRRALFYLRFLREKAQKAAEKQDTEIFLIKYKNLLEDLSNL